MITILLLFFSLLFLLSSMLPPPSHAISTPSLTVTSPLFLLFLPLSPTFPPPHLLFCCNFPATSPPFFFLLFLSLTFLPSSSRQPHSHVPLLLYFFSLVSFLCCPVPNQPPSCAMAMGHHCPQVAIHRQRAAPPICEPSARRSCQIRNHLLQDPLFPSASMKFWT